MLEGWVEDLREGSVQIWKRPCGDRYKAMVFTLMGKLWHWRIRDLEGSDHRDSTGPNWTTPEDAARACEDELKQLPS